ncbi:MAG: PorV/PorQ family protein, partial [Candidatus Krumholzibacteria bacterium]|nr:PorV/PorQ family protein [Candidatus Krumholzibacteria bacterium]
KLFSIGAGFTYLSSPDVPGFDETGNPTASLSNNSLQGILGIGITPISGLGAGVNIKYIQDRIADWTARGWAVDIGTSWTTPFHELAFGVAVQNIGNDITFIEEGEKLPTSLRAGASGAIPLPGMGVTLRIAADLVKPRFEDAYGCFGAETEFGSMLFLRAGYTDDATREGDRFSLGGGFRLFDHVVLDYAWTPYGSLGSFNRISFYVR